MRRGAWRSMYCCRRCPASMQVALVHDVVALEDAAGRVAQEHHRDAFRDPRRTRFRAAVRRQSCRRRPGTPGTATRLAATPRPQRDSAGHRA